MLWGCCHDSHWVSISRKKDWNSDRLQLLWNELVRCVPLRCVCLLVMTVLIQFDVITRCKLNGYLETHFIKCGETKERRGTVSSHILLVSGNSEKCQHIRIPVNKRRLRSHFNIRCKLSCITLHKGWLFALQLHCSRVCIYTCVCLCAGLGFSDSLLIYFLSAREHLLLSELIIQRWTQRGGGCVEMRVSVCACVSKPVWLMLMVINSTDVYSWKVQCLLSTFLFFSTSLYLLFPLICVSLPTSYIFSRTIIIPPMQSEPTHFHLPACVCVCMCVY